MAPNKQCKDSSVMSTERNELSDKVYSQISTHCQVKPKALVFKGAVQYQTV